MPDFLSQDSQKMIIQQMRDDKSVTTADLGRIIDNIVSRSAPAPVNRTASSLATRTSLSQYGTSAYTALSNSAIASTTVLARTAFSKPNPAFISAFISAFTITSALAPATTGTYTLSSTPTPASDPSPASATGGSGTEPGGILIYRNFKASSGKAVYFRQTGRFAPRIIKGRSFSQSDFAEHSNTILIEEGLMGRCVKRDGKEFFIHENREYEVIGVYKNDSKTFNENSMYYINMASEADQLVTGTYIIDAGSRTAGICRQIATALKKANPGMSIQISKCTASAADMLRTMLAEQSEIIITIMLTVLLLLMNTFDATANWLGGRQKECAVRKMAGASDLRIRFKMLKDYMLILCGSFAAGLFLSWVLSACNAIPVLDKGLDLTGTTFAFLFCMTAGLAEGVVFLKIRSGKSLSSLLR